jgi:hypothetical protein
MIKCINSNIEIYSGDNYDYNSWRIVNNNGSFNIFNNFKNSIDFCILQTGNIGIGSTNPTSKLDIIGAVNISGVTTISSNIQVLGTADIVGLITSSGGISATTVNISENIIINSENSITPISQIGTNFDEKKNIYFIGGGISRIGIGTKSPNYALDIIGSVNITGVYRKNNRDIIDDTSNYVLSTSYNTSNYVLSTSYSTSNYILSTCNILIAKADLNDINSSNYVLSTSNIISKRITDLTTDLINEKADARNKFIVDNIYNNNLSINGDLSLIYPDNNSQLVNAVKSEPQPSSLKYIEDEGYISFTYRGNPIDSVSTNYTLTTIVDLNIDILIVAGGGGGGNSGGGAGGLIYRSNINITAGRYNITVGRGGRTKENGENSSFGILYTAIGGGAGVDDITKISKNGGSGGGGTNYYNIYGVLVGASGGLGVNGQGNNGGDGTPSPNDGGGGGGAGGAGYPSVNFKGGNGGVGLEYSISGSPIYYAGGGGANEGSGGLGGGGGNNNNGTINGIENTGGGGGGANDDNNGGNGGSGIVIIKYRLSKVSQPTIKLIKGTQNDSNTDYKISNEDNNFKIISSTSNIDTDVFVINSSNITLKGSVKATSYLSGDIDLLEKIYETSNILTNKELLNDINTSNYVLSTSNILIAKTDLNDSNTSNYILSTSNILISKVDLNVKNSSNYVLSTSNIISNRISNLTTDLINEKADARNKFIIDNIYNNNLSINGDLSLIYPDNNSQLVNVVNSEPLPSSSMYIGNEGYLSFTYIETPSLPYYTSYSLTTTADIIIDILIVAGGGGGGHSGGGAGGLIYGSNINISSGKYNIEVGRGGDRLSDGINSLFKSLYTSFGYTAFGGGAGVVGGKQESKVNYGGSGGGGASYYENADLLPDAGGEGEPGQGYNGGAGILPNEYGIYGDFGVTDGGGGGGAGGTGYPSENFIGGNGGIGRIINITGSPIYYAGGGGANEGSGGLGGGGGNNNNGIINGVENTGGGGGGNSIVDNAGKGGSGIVIIKYRLSKVLQPTIKLIKGTQNDSNTDYKISNEDNNFKIISSTSNIDTDIFVINSSNITLKGSVKATSYLSGDIDLLEKIYETSNILTNKELLNDINTSNYVQSTSNILISKVNFNDINTSNYILSTCNILISLISSYTFNHNNSNNIVEINNSNLTTDLINEKADARNKFIVDNIYNNNLSINGDLSLIYPDNNSQLVNAVKSEPLPSSSMYIGNEGYLSFTYIETPSLPYYTSYSLTTTADIIIDILIVAGGGGGGHSGGGAGGLIYESNININAGKYNIEVGRGGDSLSDGANSSFESQYTNFGYTAFGGGAGVSSAYSEYIYYINSNINVNDGGSGGGGTNYYILGESSNAIGGYGVIGQGNNGGGGSSSADDGGGGGGAGGAGYPSVNFIGGNGGIGRIINITGSPIYYAGGGGANEGSGGLGGGGGNNNNGIINGVENTGGGGGGSSIVSNAGKGGSGIVIIKYKLSKVSQPTIKLIKGTQNDSNTDYKISNEDNNFKIISSTSNIDTDVFVINSSNITLKGSIKATSYLSGDIDLLEKIYETSNILIKNSLLNDINTSNYVVSTSNILVAKLNLNDSNISNYVLSTSNIISKRITDLTTDMINEKSDARNKFIVDNIYNNNLVVNGDLTINSNLILFGNTTRLETIVFTTENLEVINENVNSVAIMVKQKTENSDIFIASNQNAKVFSIANNGDVNISGIYKIDNRNVILDTSNYVLSTSNILVAKANLNDSNSSNYVLSTSNILVGKITMNDSNSSNYVLLTSNILVTKVDLNDSNSSNYVLSTSNILVGKVNQNDSNSSNYVLLTSNILVAKADLNDSNTSNYVLSTSNILVGKVNLNDSNSSNYVLLTSNILVAKADLNDSNTSNYVLSTSNILVAKADLNDKNSSNYVLSTSNILVAKANLNDSNSSNYVLSTSNILVAKANLNDSNSSNYVLSTSNILVSKANLNDSNSSNYVLSTSNILVSKANINDSNSSNYVLSTSNILVDKVNLNDSNSSNYVLSTSNILVDKVNLNDSNSSNFVLSTSNILAAKVDLNDSNSSNYVLSTSNILVGKVNLNDSNSSNYVLSTSNILVGKVNLNDSNSSNYVLSTSNILIGKVNLNDSNSSNYVLSTSNILIGKIALNDSNSSNFVLSTSNILVAKANLNDSNSSNYVLSTSNILAAKVDLNDSNSSNYVLSTSNFVVGKIALNDSNSSNYVLSTSNILIGKIALNDSNSSNYVLSTSNILAAKVDLNDSNSSNYVLSTSNILVSKIALNDSNSSNFVLSTSNILVSKIALNDNNSSNYVLSTSNILAAKVDLNDSNSSNYVLSTSNILVGKVNLNDSNSSNFVLSTSNILVSKANLNDSNSSNYVLSTSNILVSKIALNDSNSSNFVLLTSNILVSKIALNDSNSSNYVLSTSNILVSKANLNDSNSSNYVLSTSNILVSKIALNDSNSSNYVLSTSNILVTKANLNDSNSSNYVLSTSNILVGKANLNDSNSSNYVLSTSNILVAKANINDSNSSNYVLSTSNILVAKANLDDSNSSNFVLSTSNILVAKANLNDSNSSNYVLSTSNILVAKANLNDSNNSNYVLSTSNILMDYINNKNFSQWTTSDTSISIYYNGNVGIGTSVNLTNKLNIGGITNSTEYYVNNVPFVKERVSEEATEPIYTAITEPSISPSPTILSRGYILTSHVENVNSIPVIYNTLKFTYNPNYPSINADRTDILALYRFNNEILNNEILDTNPNTLITVPNITRYNLVVEAVPESSYSLSTDLFQGRKYIKGGSTETVFKSNPDGPQLNILMTTEFSVTAWIKARASETVTSRYILCQTSNEDFSPNGLYIGSTGDSTLQYIFGVNSSNSLSTGLVTYNDIDNWVHLVYVMDENRSKSIYRNGIKILSDDINNEAIISTIPIRLFISSNTDYSDLRIYKKALTSNEITDFYNSYNSNIYSINFSESNSNVIINGNTSNILLGNYLISTEYNKSSIFSTAQNEIIPLVETTNTTLTLKYPTQTYIISEPFLYKKDGFLKYVAGNSPATRNTGEWKIINYNTLGIDNSNYTLSLFDTLNDNFTLYRIKVSIDRLSDKIQTSNLISNTSNVLVSLIDQKIGALRSSELIGQETSNYVSSTSNILASFIKSEVFRIKNNEFNTDNFIEGSINKFIVNNTYNSNLKINDNLLVNSNIEVAGNLLLNRDLNIDGDVILKGDIYKNGVLLYNGTSSVLYKYSPIQTQFNIYKYTVEKMNSDWQFIDNNINMVNDTIQGFCIRIKPNHNTTKILVNLNCHIGIDNGGGLEDSVDAASWGLRLYRKIGIEGEWTHVSAADGSSLTDNQGTPCWISHNLGANTTSTSGYLMANMSGSYYDEVGIEDEYIYYTAKWCSLLGNMNANGKLYLNRPAIINNLDGYLNSPIVSSSWNATEIWQLDTKYFPKGGILAKYTPTQTEVNIYKEHIRKDNSGWQFIDENTEIINDKVKGFCARIRPFHNSSKILIKLNCNIGIDGEESTWWGLRLYRRIGEDGEWVHLSDADGINSNNIENQGTTCWISNNLGAFSSSSSYSIANVSGAYYDTPNVSSDVGAGIYVYYTVKWSSQIGDNAQRGILYLNRPVFYDVDNSANSANVTSSWTLTEIWQLDTSFIPNNVLICNNMSIQTLFNIYKNIVCKSGLGWQFIDNNVNIINNKIQGFCIRIKLSHQTSKVLLNLSCHIGIDYGTNARWWGLRLYRKIGKNGIWEHLYEADGNNLIDNKGTTCWLSHNLGAESSTSSYAVANISGTYYDLPGTDRDYVYYTVKWCAILGDNTRDGKLYLNRPAYYNNINSNNSAVLSSTWSAQEIWQLGTPYEPKEKDNTFFKIFNNDTIGVGIGDADAIYKLDVNGIVNANNYFTIDDATNKKAITTINNSLDKINSLRPISYLRKEQEDGDQKNYGFVAQELMNIIPEIVNYPTNSTPKYSIEYMSIVPILVKSIQELTHRINQQQAEIGTLNRDLNVVLDTIAFVFD